MVTLTSIAERLGVSEATVSNALSGKGRMKPETRELILREAKKEGYTIYHTVKNTIKRIIIVSEDFSQSTSSMLQGILHAAQQDGVTCPAYFLDFWGRNLPRNATANMIRPLINDLFDRLPFRPSGMIYISQYCRKIPALFDGLNIPVAAIQLLESGADVHVNFDNQQGAYDAVVHLAETGKSRIATLSGEIDTYASSERMIGYQRALIDSSLVYHPKLIWIGDWSIESGYKLTKSLLNMDERPDAIFVQNDGMAQGVITALHEHALRIPEDISVVGFDNSYYVEWLSPKLSSVRIPRYDMGAAAYQKMCELLHQRKTSNVVLPCELIQRESSCITA